MRHLLIAAVVVGFSVPAHSEPSPPCGGSPTPPFGEVNGPPQWRIWSADELRAERWQPAGCLAWSGGTKFVVAISSRFRSSDDVFKRLVNIAALPSIRYWSVSRQSWQPLALSVSAPEGASETYQFRERDENGGDIAY